MKKNLTLCAIVCTSLLILSCSTDNLEIEPAEALELKDDTFTSNRISSNNTVNFNLANQAINSEVTAETIFNNDISGWDNNVASISSNTLKIGLQAAAGTTGAMECRIDVSDNAKYELVFDVKFASGFDFSKGGKVGFGFAIGDGVTGGRNTEATVDNKGGSFRVMWRTDNGGAPYFHPYVYYKDMSGQFGTDFQSSKYNNVVANQWYRIRLTINVNTGTTSTNGVGKMEVSTNAGTSYTTVWNKTNIRWSGASTTNLKVKTLYFSTFRGGSDSTWNGGSGTQSIYFDNLSWKTL